MAFFLCRILPQMAQTSLLVEGDIWHTPSSLPAARHQRILNQTRQIRRPCTGTGRRAGTAPPGKGHHEATALQVVAQHLGHSSGLKQSGEMEHPQIILRGLNLTLERQKPEKQVVKYEI